MNTSFAAFMNKSGMACASDTDKTLYALSKQEPVALAVNFYFPIPWDTIINAYLKRGDIPLHGIFTDYAHDFVDYLLSVEDNCKWKHLSEDDGNIILLGYGTEDIFPSAVEIMVGYDETAQKLKCDFKKESSISHEIESNYFTLGNFENVDSVLLGCSKHIREKLVEKQVECFRNYKQRVSEAFKGTQYEQAVNNFISEFDERQEYSNRIEKMVEKNLKHQNIGIDFFDIEDLVRVAEMFVDCNDQLIHLKKGGKGVPGSTKELAVITRVEGVVWIKHSLYGV